MTTPLRIVTTSPAVETPGAPSAPASIAQRVLQLQAEARGLARDHIAALEASLIETRRLADEIAQGGEAYPVGVRDIARRLAEESASKALLIDAIVARI